jgi:DNA-binding response OmpR family regulator
MVAQARSLNALIVDDDQGIRISVGDVLEAAGHRPLAAGNREEAIEVARVHPIHFSIVDVHVRADDGLHILLNLRQLLGVLPVIFMSGAFTPELVARAQALGARRCLEKPLNVVQLLAAVQELIHLEDL